jgi:LysR family transcriptional regulator of gallate degradation
VQLHKLRAFAAVAEYGNVHRAALAIHLSQPAVSRAVQQLETALGAPLFERTTKGMTLTQAGSQVLRRVQRALRELRLAETAIRRAAHGDRRAARQAAPPADAARARTSEGDAAGPGAARPGAARPHRLAAIVTERMLASLVAIAQGGGEAAAASLMGISQPALNRHLHQLEQLAQAALFVRSGRGTRLTDAGEALLRHAKLALAEIRVAQEEMASLQGRLNGRLVVGALPLSSGYLIPRAVDQTLRDHPGLTICIIDGTYATLSHGLRGAEVNIIVGALRADEQEPFARHEALFNDSLSVVARAHHPMLARGPIANLRDLVGENWVMPLAGTPSRAAFERAFRAEGIEPPVASIEGNSPAIVRALLLSSDRLALLSQRQVQQELQQGILKVLPVEVRDTERPIGLAVLRDGEPSPAALAFIAALRQSAEI